MAQAWSPISVYAQNHIFVFGNNTHDETDSDFVYDNTNPNFFPTTFSMVLNLHFALRLA